MFGNFTFGSAQFALPDFEKLPAPPAPPAPKGGGPWQNWNWLEHPLRPIEVSDAISIEAEARCFAVAEIEAECVIRFTGRARIEAKQELEAETTLSLSMECERLGVKLLPPKVRPMTPVRVSAAPDFGTITLDSPRHDADSELLLLLLDDL